MSIPKNHHYISAFVLRRFTGPDGFLAVRRLDDRPEYKASPEKIGSETNGYRVTEDFAEDPVVYERRMSALEAEASIAIQEIIDSNVATVPHSVREILVRLLVLHALRHRALRDMIRDDFIEENGEILECFGRDATREITNWVVAAQAMPAFADDIRAAGDGAARMSVYHDLFQHFDWHVIRYQRPSLIIGDKLVCASGLWQLGNDGVSYEASLEGRAGLARSWRVTVPLSPACGLILSRNGAVTHLGAKEFNKTTVLNAREFIAYPSNWPLQEPALAKFVDRIFRSRLKPSLETVK